MSSWFRRLVCLWHGLFRRKPVESKPTCDVCGGRLPPSGNCFNTANDGTHAIDGDGWPG